MAEAERPLALSETLHAVLEEAGGEPCDAKTLVLHIIRTHQRRRGTDYAGGRAEAMAEHLVAWPEGAVVLPVSHWYDEARSLLALPEAESPDARIKGGSTGAPAGLRGRRVILAVALADRASGREMVRAGLFAAIAEEIEEGLPAALSDRGRERLASIPLAAGFEDVEPAELPHGQRLRVSLSTDGRRALTYGRDGLVLWNVAGRFEIGRISRVCFQAHFSADGRSVVAVLADGVRSWPTVRFEGPGERLLAVEGVFNATLSQDAATFVVRTASQPDGTVTVVDLSTGSLLPLQGGSEIMHIAVTATGSVVALSDGRQIELHNRNRQGFERVGTYPVDLLRWLDCNDAGQLVVGSESSIVVFHGQTLVEAGVVPVDEPRTLLADVHPQRLSLNNDGTALAVAESDAVLLIHPVTGVVLARVPAAATEHLSFSLDGRRLITASDDGTARVWDVGVELPAAPPAPSTYTADRADDDRDLLKRSRDVEAFASLIAARTVEAPLSIGLFGDWGSGKSWFMGQLRRRVAAIAADARESGALQREVTFFKHIAQVEFNAWHYAEGDVLASLVDHIFSRLDLGEGVGYVEQEQARRLKKVAAAQLESAKAEHEREKAVKELADIQQERRDKEREREIQRAELEATIPALAPAVPTELQQVASGALAAVGWARVPEVVSELRHELVAARAELGRTAGLLTPLVRGQPGEVTRQRWVALVLLAAGPLAALVVGTLVAVLSTEAKAALSGAGALLVAGVAGVSRFVSQQTSWLRQRLDSLDEAERRIDVFIAEQLKEIDKDIAELRDKELEKQKEVEDKAVALTTTQKVLEDTQAKLNEATPTRLLQDLIQGTVKAGEYARRLGVVAQARHDFENVSDIIKSLNVELEGMTSLDQEKDVQLNRIVLYIDDLDRCEPDKVVQVLQAVHLLLAFPLFVVVVGVDSRWVARALRKRYPELLDADGATPNDYLEKIFQIPFWLDPLDVGKTKRMLQGLMSVTPAVVPARRPTPAPTEEPSGSESQDGGVQGTGTGRTDTELGAAAAPPAPDRVASSRELNPRGLELQPVELQAMEALAEIVGRSPRTLKRFVNVYRLVKVRLADPLDFVESSRADYRVVLYLLAFMTGRPDAAAELFDDIRATGDDDQLEGVPAGWPTTARPYKRWVDDIARFSFDMRRPPMEPPAAAPPTALQQAGSQPA